jgi:hypothetical protein
MKYIQWCETHHGAAKRVGGTDDDPQIWCWESELRYAASVLWECEFVERELGDIRYNHEWDSQGKCMWCNVEIYGTWSRRPCKGIRT